MRVDAPAGGGQRPRVGAQMRPTGRTTICAEGGTVPEYEVYGLDLLDPGGGYRSDEKPQIRIAPPGRRANETAAFDLSTAEVVQARRESRWT